jgi:hypothetical protein
VGPESLLLGGQHLERGTEHLAHPQHVTHRPTAHRPRYSRRKPDCSKEPEPSYKIVARPDVRFAHAGQIGFPLTTERVVSELGGAVVRTLSEDRRGRTVVDLHLERPTHEEALSEILLAVNRLGFSLVEATVSEWANEVVERAVIGALGGGGAIGTASDDVALARLAAAVGAIVGAWSGAQVQRLAHRYEARLFATGWQLTEISQPQPAVQRLRPGVSPV